MTMINPVAILVLQNGIKPDNVHHNYGDIYKVHGIVEDETESTDSSTLVSIVPSAHSNSLPEQHLGLSIRQRG